MKPHLNYFSAMQKIILILPAVILISCATQKIETPASDSTAVFIPKSCLQDPEKQNKRSEELQKIVTADQNDRMVRPIDWSKVYPRDVMRIQRVGEIFAEGCIVTGKDYAAAALVFQHGDHPDHYLQTYLWQKRAVELGEGSNKGLMLAGLDRYLVSTGHKQLFATQYSKTTEEKCTCLQDVEDTFPERKRLEMGGKTLKQAMEYVLESNKDRSSCKRITFCGHGLKTTAKGVLPIPGIW